MHLGQLFEPLSRRFERLRGLSQRTPFHLRSPLTALIGVTLVGELVFLISAAFLDYFIDYFFILSGKAGTGLRGN